MSYCRAEGDQLLGERAVGLMLSHFESTGLEVSLAALRSCPLRTSCLVPASLSSSSRVDRNLCLFNWRWPCCCLRIMVHNLWEVLRLRRCDTLWTAMKAAGLIKLNGMLFRSKTLARS